MRKMRRYRIYSASAKKWIKDSMTKKETKKTKILPKVRRSTHRKLSLKGCNRSWITRVRAQHFRSRYLKSSKS